MKTLLLKPQGYYKEIQQTRNTTQPDTVVTIYADRAVWGIFLSRPPRQSGEEGRPRRMKDIERTKREGGRRSKTKQDEKRKNGEKEEEEEEEER